MEVDRWGIDASYSGTQKCLSCPPGLSPVTFSRRAMEKVASRRTPVRTWYFDLGLIGAYLGGERVYHHTAPVSMVLALREALRIVLEEGLEARFERHRRNAAALRAGLEALGLEVVTPEGFRLDQITPVWIPDGIDDLEVRQHLLRDHHIEIGRGLGEFAGKAWRIGLMGDSSKPEHVFALLAALESILPRVGFEVAYGAGVASASRSLATGLGARHPTG